MSLLSEPPAALPREQAAEVEQLHKLLQKQGPAYLLGPGGEPRLRIPDVVFRLLVQVVDDLRNQRAVQVVPYQQELTTQQAAAILGVSRPHVIKLIHTNELSHHRVGTHRRLYLREVLRYQQTRKAERKAALTEMAKTADAMGVYDKVILPQE